LEQGLRISPSNADFMTIRPTIIEIRLMLLAASNNGVAVSPDPQ
jgi:hypothetical protein